MELYRQKKSKFWHVTVPLMAPVPVAWITLGFDLNDTLAAELKQRTMVSGTTAITATIRNETAADTCVVAMEWKTSDGLNR